MRHRGRANGLRRNLPQVIVHTETTRRRALARTAALSCPQTSCKRDCSATHRNRKGRTKRNQSHREGKPVRPGPSACVATYEGVRWKKQTKIVQRSNNCRSLLSRDLSRHFGQRQNCPPVSRRRRHVEHLVDLHA